MKPRRSCVWTFSDEVALYARSTRFHLTTTTSRACKRLGDRSLSIALVVGLVQTFQGPGADRLANIGLQPTAAGRNDLPPRLKPHVSLLAHHG
jgi:hypothetical protein